VASLRYTPLRHRVLAEVAHDRDFFVSIIGGTGHRAEKFEHKGGRLPVGEQRTLRTLASARAVQATPQIDWDADRPLTVTRAGSALLSEWNTKYGNPLTG
jgi:hypothetical protein